MKLSHLSLAIFAAISLAACGGSSNGDQVTPENQPEQNQPEQNQPEQNQPDIETPKGEAELVDPTGDEVVTNFDPKTASSQGGIQYLRNEDSKFDRGNNPTKPASATSLLGVDLNNQNPWFTNYVAARTKFPKDAKQDEKSVTVAQYLGTEKASEAGLSDSESLQTANWKNIARFGGNSATGTNNDGTDNTVSEGPTKAEVKDFFENDTDGLKVDYEEYVKNLKNKKKDVNDSTGLSNQEKKEQKKALDEALSAAKMQYDTLKKQFYARADKAPFIALNRNNEALYNDSDDVDFIWGDGVTSNDDNAEKAAIGLVGMNFELQNDQGVTQSGTKADVQGTDDAALSSSRIFGRYFLASDDPDNKKAQNNIKDGLYNSYRKATTYISDADIEFDNADRTANEIVTGKEAEYTDTEYGFAVEPLELVNVQYGRVTGQLDPAVEPVEENVFKVGGNTVEQRSPFLGRADKEAVNYYFYRGTDATTVAQMAALPSDAEFLYQGHALMYGLDNRFHGNGQNLPNSFGKGDALGLGNFVVAKYNVGEAKVGGYVYNAWQFDKNSDELTIDKLVNFGGKVSGNTVVGSAELAYKQAAPADFRGSFFGDKAQELGGSFNSTTWTEKYGPAEGNAAWGGVFGAQRVTEAETTTVDNSWLGDIGASVRK